MACRAKRNKYFEGERLYLRKIVGKTLLVAYVTDENVADQSVYIAKIVKNSINALYLVAVLNSKLIAWYFRNRHHEFDDIFPQIKIVQFKELPIIVISIDLQDSFIDKSMETIGLKYLLMGKKGISFTESTKMFASSTGSTIKDIMELRVKPI